MNIANIEGILESKVWKKIIKNSNYRGHYIIDTQNKPKKKRYFGQLFVICIFFHNGVRDKTLMKYHLEGCKVPKRKGYESLDNTNIHRFYGTMKMITFS